MFGLGKKKKEEEELLEEDLPAKKKFKDLKSENKRKRKEPLKPWGKGERILVLIVLGVTVGVSAILSATARGDLNLSLGSLTLPRVLGESITFDQTFSFGKKQTSVDCCSQAVNKFRSLTDNLTGTYGFYVVRLNGATEYGSNEDVTFKAASLIKLPTVIALYKEVENGNISLEDKHILTNWEKVDGNGSLLADPAGTTISYRDLAKFTIIQSDNTAFNILENFLSDRKIQETIQNLEMTKTSITDNETSPKDIALLLKNLKDAKYLNQKDSDEILTYMEDTDFDSWLRAGIPTGIKVAHKFGREVNTVNDAGIIYSKKPYIVVILSRDVNETEADNIFPQLSRAIYDFESN